MNVVDVQLTINQVLGIVPCTNADLQQNGQCNVIDVHAWSTPPWAGHA